MVLKWEISAFIELANHISHICWLLVQKRDFLWYESFSFCAHSSRNKLILLLVFQIHFTVQKLDSNFHRELNAGLNISDKYSKNIPFLFLYKLFSLFSSHFRSVKTLGHSSQTQILETHLSLGKLYWIDPAPWLAFAIEHEAITIHVHWQSYSGTCMQIAFQFHKN
jgi:hypothetical protein